MGLATAGRSIDRWSSDGVGLTTNGRCIMDMMGMIGHFAVHTVQEISAEDGVWSGGVTYPCRAWWLHMLAYMFD